MKPVPILTFVAAAFSLCGCKTYEKTAQSVGLSKTPPAIVAMTFEGDTVEVPVPARGSEAYLAALNSLRYKDYGAAVTQLQALTIQKPEDAKARFALAVAREASGDYAKAREDYVLADQLDGPKANPDCEAGATRCDLRLGR